MSLRQQHKVFWLLLAVSAVSVGIYLASSARTIGLGFPLDDAWIHQTYARNLGENGSWTFLPGQTSAGSTSPLWTGILSIGYLLKISPLFVSTCLGLFTLMGVGLVYDHAGKRFFGQDSLPWFGLFAVLEWHFVWAALSGMETLLFSLLVLVSLFPLIVGIRIRWWMGIFCGLAVWIRPEGVTLLAPLVLGMIFDTAPIQKKISSAGLFLLGFTIIFVPYLILNDSISGSVWPNTFYAKQAEYSELLSQPILIRLWGMVLPFLTGGGILLLPGLFGFLVKSGLKKDWRKLLVIAWWVGTLGLYALRMPVTYQHGRYLIPAMSIYFLLSLVGTREIVKNLSDECFQRVIKRSLLASIILVLGGFWILGAGAYARDVAIIESEMVDTSAWIEGYSEPGSVIAAHDIGALGFFGRRTILDLAGLINPEVIPIIRNETELANYLDRKKPDYLITFPGWYPQLVDNLVPEYCSDSIFSIQAGGENMCIYKWPSSGD